jgi:hypothetical protein
MPESGAFAMDIEGPVSVEQPLSRFAGNDGTEPEVTLRWRNPR